MLVVSLSSCFFVSNRAELAPPLNDDPISPNDPTSPNENPLPTGSENYSPITVQKVSSTKHYGIIVLEPNSPQGYHESDLYRLSNRTLFFNTNISNAILSEEEN